MIPSALVPYILIGALGWYGASAVGHTASKIGHKIGHVLMHGARPRSTPTPQPAPPAPPPPPDAAPAPDVEDPCLILPQIDQVPLFRTAPAQQS